MTVIYYLFSVLVSFLTARIALLFYLKAPSEWLCETGTTPEKEHSSEYRCPQRKPAFFLMSAVTELSFIVSGKTIPCSLPDLGELLFLSATALILFPAALSDVDYYIIPDQTCLAVFLLTLLRTLSRSGPSGLSPAILGGIICGGMMLIASLLGQLISEKESIGMGDVKLLTACGALVSSTADPGLWVTAACSVYISSVLSSAVWFSALLLCRRVQYGEACPLAPWIVLSTLLMMALW